MAPSFVRGDDPDQQFLLPPDARQWLPAGHLAWQLLSVISEFDVSEFVAAYRADGRSRPAYHPVSMLTLVMYCYCKGVRSSRGIEMACWDDLGARVIMGNLYPDHATVARFVTRHREAIKKLLIQTLVVAAGDGLVRVDVVAGDGTVVRANASKTKNVTAEQLGLDIAELEVLIAAEVESWCVEAAAADAADDDALFDDGDDDDASGSASESALTRMAGMLVRRRQAQTRLAERAEPGRVADRARLEAATARVDQREQALVAARAAYQAKSDDWHARDAATPGGLPGTRPVPVDDHATVRRAAEQLAKAHAAHTAAEAAVATGGAEVKVNTTDPASRIMPGKNGGFVQAYNMQIVADAGQLILHIGTHDNPADVEALHPGLHAARANLNAAGITTPIGTALFDAGYASDDNFTTTCPDPDTTLLVAVTNEARQTGRRTDRPGRTITIESWQQMATRLDTADGKTVYKQRAAIIEPVFAQLFARLGRHLNYRGPGVDTELGLMGATHNLGKIIKRRLARTTPTAATAAAT